MIIDLNVKNILQSQLTTLSLLSSRSFVSPLCVVNLIGPSVRSAVLKCQCFMFSFYPPNSDWSQYFHGTTKSDLQWHAVERYLPTSQKPSGGDKVWSKSEGRRVAATNWYRFSACMMYAASGGQMGILANILNAKTITDYNLCVHLKWGIQFRVLLFVMAAAAAAVLGLNASNTWMTMLYIFVPS